MNVSIGLVTRNSRAYLPPCFAGLAAQRAAPLEILAVDNGSTDGSAEWLKACPAVTHLTPHDRNTGFSAAHNELIRRSRGDLYVALNPDVRLNPDFLGEAVRAFDLDPRVGAVAGKLLRADESLGPIGGRAVIDSAGIYMVRSIRHLDRGAGEPDTGQFDAIEYVFGASGAAAAYRRTMLDEVAVAGEWFDEDFFAYREDADLAWRAQLLGWRALYTPRAVAYHVRRVTPERRAELPAEVNYHSVKNRFLLRLKNQTWGHALRHLGPSTFRDLQVVGYVLLREHASLGALAEVVRLLPRALRKRRIIMRRRDAAANIEIWFRRRALPFAPLGESSEAIHRASVNGVR